MSRIGFIFGVFDRLDWNTVGMLKNYLSDSGCDKLAIGLFTDDFSLRFKDCPADIGYQARADFLTSLNFIDRVIPVDWENFSIQKIGFIPDAYIIGSEYGKLYLEDKNYCLDKGITIKVSGSVLNPDALINTFANVYVEYRIILFGTGKYFDVYMNSQAGHLYPPAYAVDNNSDKWGTVKSGVEIKSPEALIDETADNVIILVCIKDSDAVLTQLSKLGDFDYRKLLVNAELARYDDFAVSLWDEQKHLKRVNTILEELMVEFDKVCRKYDLKYFLTCGSAIGAVRHQGFIPWDDDLDVAMLQEDFDVLCQHADEIWPEGSDYKLVRPGDLGNGAFLDFMNRLMCVREDVDTNIFTKVKGKADDYVHYKACLDIYIYNTATANSRKQQRNVMYLKAVYGLGMGHRAYVNMDTYKNYDSFTRFVVRVTSGVGRILPLSFIIKLHEYYARRFDKLNTGLTYESNGYAMTMVFDRKVLGDGRRIPVCGHDIMVAENVDEYLTTHGYVNYMNYPPANHRKPTHALKSPDLV